ncbi:MAG TPA: hypothetical protein PK686_00675 [bacterium]|nr:hypothetical protein [bacterium]HPV65183.1 hypothetical protein [bacterium]
MEKLASITILTTNRQQNSSEINGLLTDSGHLIISRMGVNVQKSCTEHCPGMILLALKGEESKILELLNNLNKIEETKAEIHIFEE